MAPQPLERQRCRRLAWAALVIALVAPSCRCSGGADGAAHAQASAPTTTDPATSASVDAAGALDDDPDANDDSDASDDDRGGESGTRFRDAAPLVDVDLEAPPDQACSSGEELALAQVVADPRCAIDLPRAKKLRSRLEREDAGTASTGGGSLRQEAKVVEQNRIRFRLVNASGASIALPLSFHGKVPSFSVLAEDEHHTLYELEPPALDLADRGQGARAHVARIVLRPGGSAVATLTVDPRVTQVLARGAADPCKTCNVARLGKGRYVLHVGELLTGVAGGPGVFAGELADPARVEWELR